MNKREVCIRGLTDRKQKLTARGRKNLMAGLDTIVESELRNPFAPTKKEWTRLRKAGRAKGRRLDFRRESPDPAAMNVRHYGPNQCPVSPEIKLVRKLWHKSWAKLNQWERRCVQRREAVQRAFLKLQNLEGFEKLRAQLDERANWLDTFLDALETVKGAVANRIAKVQDAKSNVVAT